MMNFLNNSSPYNDLGNFQKEKEKEEMNMNFYD